MAGAEFLGIPGAGWLQAGSSILGNAVRQAPDVVSSSASAYLDSSGWNVSLGSGDISSEATRNAGAAFNWQAGLMALAALAAFVWLRK